MPKWRRNPQGESKDAPVPPPFASTETSLPDPQEAREALAQSQENKRRTEEFSEEVKEILRFIRAAREENNFAEGIVEMIKKGR